MLGRGVRLRNARVYLENCGKCVDFHRVTNSGTVAAARGAFALLIRQSLCTFATSEHLLPSLQILSKLRPYSYMWESTASSRITDCSGQKSIELSGLLCALFM